jgi:hypothetical protein
MRRNGTVLHIFSKIFHALLFCSVVGQKVPHFGTVTLVLGRVSLRPLPLFPLLLCASCLRVFGVQLHLHISTKNFTFRLKMYSWVSSKNFFEPDFWKIKYKVHQFLRQCLENSFK